MAGRKKTRAAVIGAGLGGTVAAVLLRDRGFDVTVYEQAKGFSRLGAGINLSPNVTRVLREVGILDRLREIGVLTKGWLSRKWDSGETLFELPLGKQAEQRYGAPYITIHRGDFHAELIAAVGEESLQFDKRLVDLDPEGDTVRINFADGTKAEADIVVGADGVNSMVREVLLGPEKPIYTGHVGHRSIFPVSRLGGLQLPDITKWWAEDRHLVVYFVTRKKEEIYFVSGVPEPEWNSESSWVDCDVEELRAAFEGFHPEVQALMDACPAVTKWAFFERKPLPLWSSGRIVLLGDACHPMKPHMGQGAAMAIEDAAMLARCFDELPDGDFHDVFALYAANRMERTEHVQTESRANTWLKYEQNPDWVFDYNVFDVPLEAPPGASSKTGTGS